MTYKLTHSSTSKFKYSTLIAAILLSGLCYYYGNGLNGDYWYLLWLAPLPVLIVSLVSSGKQTFIISFIAYVLGRLSWFSYFVALAGIVPAIIFTMLPSLIFALIICITRQAIYKINSWYVVFAFPALFTTFEYLLIKLSPDGTGGSIAYSQLNFLPVIQIASITGILGITFFVTLIPSAIVLGWHFRKEKSKLLYTIVCSVFLTGATLLFGILRLKQNATGNTIKVGLSVFDEKKHNNSNQPDSEKDKLVTDFYISQVSQFAEEGAQVIIFPERALSIDILSVTHLLDTLRTTARQNKICIITGYTNLVHAIKYNSALVINARGDIVANYNKAYLVKGQEEQFKPGNSIGLFKLNGIQVGVAICKDMDFQDYIKQYGTNGISIMFVPAWDFIVDDWLHSRMAVLRGVENGFSELRAAREGELTISDFFGRVTYQSGSSNAGKASLTGAVSTQRINTIYTRFGNWFGIINLLATFILFALLYKKRR